jgi:AMP phosphorylase
MAFYLRSKNLDLGKDNDFNIVLNRKDAERLGVREGEIALIGVGEVELYANVLETDTEVAEGEVGLFEEIWKEYNMKNGYSIFVDIPRPSESLDIISKKLLGRDLSEKDLEIIMKDIGEGKLREVEIAFFISTFFNPGFNDNEIYWMTKGMANSGDILSFKGIRENGNIVVDKHSIGGVAGKAITPTLVPILVAGGLIVPNSSSRAITSPAGTSDILEVVMPVTLAKEKVIEVVKQTGGCMFWGGSLDLSPADDVIINVERSLKIQEFQKVLVSIVAKKISMGITHILIDLPYGKGSKVERVDDVNMLEREFKKLFKKFNIECETMRRPIRSLDARSVGPNLEIREALRILERDEKRSREVEKIVIEMATRLFEMTKKVRRGEGKKLAREILDSGKALDKFWEIAFAQGATRKIQASDIRPATLQYDLLSDRDGIVKCINNVELVVVSRALGNPKIKEAGIYVYKTTDEEVKKGDKLLTIYATTESRLESGRGLLDIDKLYTFK